MRRLCFIVIGLVSACAKPAADPADPRIAVMNALDLAVVLPAGAGALAHYERHYGWADPAHRKVRAVFLASDLPGRSWHPDGKLPEITDGGCNVVRIVFDTASGAFDSVECNGVA